VERRKRTERDGTRDERGKGERVEKLGRWGDGVDDGKRKERL
jgi:hypothetical protein